VPAAWTPTDAYVLQFDPTLMAMAHPANRQAISRWIKFAQSNKEVVISDYLNAAMGRMTDSSQFVLALDLADIPQRHRIEERLTESKTVGGNESKIKQLVDLIAGLQGITVTVSVTDTINAELRVDFRDDVKPLGNLAKPLIIEALNNFDVHLSDLVNFDATLNAKSVVLSGPLSMDGLRRVGSLLEMSSTKFSDLKDVNPAEAGSSDVVNASLAYYKSIKADRRSAENARRHARQSRRVDGALRQKVDACRS
jgi:hypothetical protein